jgi:predicted Zn-dependent protease with MMP-like domain
MKLAEALRWTAIALTVGCIALGGIVPLVAWAAGGWFAVPYVLALSAGSLGAAVLVLGTRRRRLREYAESELAVAGSDGLSVEGIDVQALAFEQLVQRALRRLPPDLAERMSNVELVVEDEPPAGRPLLGLYEGVPLTRRGPWYGAVAPDKITIYRGPIERLSRGDPLRLEREVEHVVLHEVAHHFGISDERLIEIDRY